MTSKEKTIPFHETLISTFSNFIDHICKSSDQIKTKSLMEEWLFFKIQLNPFNFNKI